MNSQELFITMKKVCTISLSLLLLLAMGTEGMVTLGRNQCMCRSVSDANIPLRRVINFEVLHAGPSCNKLEYIVTLKPFQKQEFSKICLDPTSKKVQEMYKQYRALQKSQPMRRRPIRPQ